MTDQALRAQRRWIRGIRPWVLVGVGCVLVGAAIGFTAARLIAAPFIGHYASPGSILISADQRTLTASAGEACETGSLDVQESSSTVMVRLHLLPAIMIAPGSCGIENFSTTLQAPLGKRQLIDGVTGARLPSFEGRGILRPTFLPAGFVHRYDAAFFGRDTVTGASAGCTQVYSQGDSYDEAIWISQFVGGHWRTPAGVKAKPIIIRGRPGLAVGGEIEWTARGELFTIQSMTYAYATLPTSSLIAIADSLR